MPKPSIAGLRSLAGQKGFDVERAYMRDHWRLKSAAGEWATKPKTNAVAFSISEAMAFLQDKPDR